MFVGLQQGSYYQRLSLSHACRPCGHASQCVQRTQRPLDALARTWGRPPCLHATGVCMHAIMLQPHANALLVTHCKRRLRDMRHAYLHARHVQLTFMKLP